MAAKKSMARAKKTIGKKAMKNTRGGLIHPIPRVVEPEDSPLGKVRNAAGRGGALGVKKGVEPEDRGF